MDNQKSRHSQEAQCPTKGSHSGLIVETTCRVAPLHSVDKNEQRLHGLQNKPPTPGNPSKVVEDAASGFLTAALNVGLVVIVVMY